MNIVRRKIGKKRYVYDKETKIYIITWNNLVNFWYDRKSENIKYLDNFHAPLPLRMKIIKDKSTILFTDGRLFKIIETYNEEIKKQKDSLNIPIKPILRFILENYDKIKNTGKTHSKD